MNQNEIAQKIAKLEGGKKNLSIAQIKEVMLCYHKVLADHTAAEVLAHFSKIIVQVQKGKKR